jgi:hypothetical protein
MTPTFPHFTSLAVFFASKASPAMSIDCGPVGAGSL